MTIDIIEDIYNELPRYLLKNDGTLLRESEDQNGSEKKKTADPDKIYLEGAKEIYKERKERKRDPNLRPDALKEYGTVCAVCNTNFGSALYGKYGVKCLEVHHLEPISGGERKTKLSDVRIVCSNCHSILHSNGKYPLGINELKNIILRGERTVLIG